MSRTCWPSVVLPFPTRLSACGAGGSVVSTLAGSSAKKGVWAAMVPGRDVRQDPRSPDVLVAGRRSGRRCPRYPGSVSPRCPGSETVKRGTGPARTVWSRTNSRATAPPIVRWRLRPAWDESLGQQPGRGLAWSHPASTAATATIQVSWPCAALRLQPRRHWQSVPCRSAEGPCRYLSSSSDSIVHGLAAGDTRLLKSEWGARAPKLVLSTVKLTIPPAFNPPQEKRPTRRPAA